MSNTGAGKGPKRRLGENPKNFHSGWDCIKWPSQEKKKEKEIVDKNLKTDKVD